MNPTQIICITDTAVSKIGMGTVIGFGDSHVIDYAAQAKLKGAYVKHAARMNVLPTSIDIIPAADDISAGVHVSEAITNSQRPDHLIVTVNYAPPDNLEGTSGNRRKDFFMACLDNRTVICGTNNGFEFSYIKPAIPRDGFYRLTNTNHLNSQFRSLDVLPEYALSFSKPLERDKLIKDGMLEPVNPERNIPSIPDVTHVFHIDNFGNVKLCLSKKDRKNLDRLVAAKKTIHFAFCRWPMTKKEPGAEVFVSKSQEAIVTDAFFAAPLGATIMTVNSSSILCGKKGPLSVAMIATLRHKPAATRPAYSLGNIASGSVVRLSP